MHLMHAPKFNYRYLAQWSDSDTTLVMLLQLWIQLIQLTHPYKCSME